LEGREKSLHEILPLLQKVSLCAKVILKAGGAWYQVRFIASSENSTNTPNNHIEHPAFPPSNSLLVTLFVVT